MEAGIMLWPMYTLAVGSALAAAYNLGRPFPRSYDMAEMFYEIQDPEDPFGPRGLRRLRPIAAPAR